MAVQISQQEQVTSSAFFVVTKRTDNVVNTSLLSQKDD